MSDQSHPGVGAVLGAAGACPEILCGGKLWRVGHPTQAAKSRLEDFAAATAIAEVRALKTVLPPDAYADAWKDTLADVQAKQFRTWGAGWRRVVFDPQNFHLFFLTLLRENHPEATEADAKALLADEPELVAAALARVVPDFFTVLLVGVRLTLDQQAAVAAAIARLLATLSPPQPSPPTP